jgi:hypothetical protein
MLPDLRFAIGAVLASALLIVTAFGLAATVRVAHHRAETPDDPWRLLAFADPADWGLLSAPSRPGAAAKADPPPDRPAATTPDPDTTGTIAKHEPGAETAAIEQLAALDPAPATITPTAPAAVPAEPATAPATATSATDPAPEPVAAAIPETLEVVAALPEIATAPVQPAATPPDVDTPDVKIPNAEAEVLESSERVAVLPAFPTAGHGFVPPQHPVALPAPEPAGKPAVKKPAKKKADKRRPHPRPAVTPPLANTGFPVFGFEKVPAAGYDKTPVISYDKKWTVE